MSNESQTIRAIAHQGVLPLFYHSDADVCIRILSALYEAGIRVVEFTNRGPGALHNFGRMMQQSFPDLMLGAGTIKTADEAQAFLDLGARFLVSPVFDAGVCDKAYLQKTLWVPGCMTPTEIHVARQAGCSLVKLFPAQVLGVSFLQAIRPLFAGMEFLATGGVLPTAESMGPWLKAGACAVGLGSQLVPAEPTDMAELSKRSRQALQLAQRLGRE
jgi:2-dehydro-3-deoxyphosphogluconate aldolase/(4S)-4-hydroxy-2-oxoglutarate aldolase